MSTGSRTPDHIRTAAVTDYKATRDPYHVVAARHGVSRAALHAWVNRKPTKPRGPFQWAEEEIALTGGRWVLDPVKRVQRWVA